MLSRLVVRIGSLEAVSGKGAETDVTALYGGVRDADLPGGRGACDVRETTLPAAIRPPHSEVACRPRRVRTLRQPSESSGQNSMSSARAVIVATSAFDQKMAKLPLEPSIVCRNAFSARSPSTRESTSGRAGSAAS